MSTLEYIYLMNVSLYLKLTDIPVFVRINHKSKDVCDGLRINPINDDTIDLRKSIKIINSYFPRLETLYLTKGAFEIICSNVNKYHLPNVELFKTNEFVYLNTISNYPQIMEGIDKISIDCSSDNFNLKSVQSINLSIYWLSYVENSLKELSSLKRIHFYGSIQDFIAMDGFVITINSFSKNYQVILNFQWYYEDIKTILSELRCLSEFLNKEINIKYECNYGITEYYKTDEIPKTEDDFIGELWHKRISKDYFPTKLLFKNNQNLNVLHKFETVKEVVFDCPGPFTLPSSVEKIESKDVGRVIIQNWNELNQIKCINHYDYNINTPQDFRKFERNNKKRDYLETVMFIIGLIRIFTNSMAFVAISYSIFNNGLLDLKNHFISIFPFLTITLLTYMFCFGIYIFTITNNYSRSFFVKTILTGLTLLVYQYLGILFYDQRYYGSYCSEFLFFIPFSILFFGLDLFTFYKGFDYKFLVRLIKDLFPNLLDSLFFVIFVIVNVVQRSLSLKFILFCCVFPFCYCFVFSLFTTQGWLFVGNIFNLTLTIIISGVLAFFLL